MKLRPLLVACFIALIGYAVGEDDDDNVAASEESVAVDQARSLFRFYLSTRMFSFRSRRKHNWFQGGLVSDEYCNYTGVKCDNEGYVTVLDLRKKRLSGTLSFGNFTRLRVLRLTSNNIRGPIPALSMAPLQELRIINVGDNDLSGTIPDMSHLASLERLMLFENSLTGPMPTTLCKLSDMTHLFLSGNEKMRGTLPACLANLSQLSALKVTNVGLTGTLPTSICQLSRLNRDTSNCDMIGCSAGYFRVKGNGTSAARCMPCEVPSNIVASTACLWISNSEFPSDIPTTVPSISPSAAPSTMAPSAKPTAIQAVEESATPTMALTLSSTPTAMPNAITNIVSASQARKRSITISAVVALTLMSLIVFVLAVGARKRRELHEQIELDSADDDAMSFDELFACADSVTSSQNVGIGSSPARNSKELRSPTSLPFIRPRRSLDSQNSNKGNGISNHSSSLNISASDSRLDMPTAIAASTNPLSPTVGGQGLLTAGVADGVGKGRIRSSLKPPAVDNTLVGLKERSLMALKQVRFSSGGNSIRTYYEDSDDDNVTGNEEKNGADGSFFWTKSSTNPTSSAQQFQKPASRRIEDDADASTFSTDSIYAVKRPATQPRSCPSIGFGLLSCGALPLEEEKVSSELKETSDGEDGIDDIPPCLPCPHKSRKTVLENSRTTPMLIDEACSVGQSSSDSVSSEDEIMTSLGVIHEDDNSAEESKWTGGMVRQSRHFMTDRFSCIQHALIDDESTLVSKDSTLFSNESERRYKKGEDHAEI